jgi:hypothetical protein
MDKATIEKIREDKCKEKEETRLKIATNLGFIVDRKVQFFFEKRART